MAAHRTEVNATVELLMTCMVPPQDVPTGAQETQPNSVVDVGQTWLPVTKVHVTFSCILFHTVIN